MEQPKLGGNSSPPPQKSTKPQKINPPTPQQLISHYESQGLTTQDAAIKVIDDLQHMLFRIVTSKKPNNSTNSSTVETSRKLDSINARLAIVDRKIDSKPGYSETFVVGVVAASAARGLVAVWPQVAGAVFSVWNSVRGSTKN